jgi:urate oxidase
MTSLSQSYGKGRVRIMRVQREDDCQQVRELSVQVMLHGAFDRAYTHADNRAVIATDTIKNIVNIAAREAISATAEDFCLHLAKRFLDRYAQVDRVSIRTLQTQWRRLESDGVPHPHAFLLDANGKPTVALEHGRGQSTMRSGIEGFTFLKSTGSGWADYLMDEYTTLAETQDRIAATSMDATWLWSTLPGDVERANAAILAKLLHVFATTYSHSVQDSLYRMAQAALSATPEVAEIALSCPNKHYLPIDLSPFGMNADNLVFTPTDEPHGQIECILRKDGFTPDDQPFA